MNFLKLLDEFYDYLIGINFGSAKLYRDWLEKIYHDFPKAKNLLNKLANESDNLEQLKICINLIESIYCAKENETDKTIESKLGDWHSVAMKLVDFIQSRVVIVPRGYLTEKNIHAIFAGKVGLTMKKPYTPPKQGRDQETQRIRYENNVTQEEQVPGLCIFLENEYECILGFARTLFGDWVDTLHPRRIPVILKKECPAKVYRNSDEYVTQKINELVKQNKTINTEEIAEILRYEMRVAGYFIQAPEPHIEIFFRQFDAKCWEDYASQIAQVLAHEYLHYLHYAYAKEKFSDAEAGLKEALADFFGVLYSINCGDKYALEVAANRYDLWKKREGSGWPYADALWFYRVHGNEMEYSSNYSDYECFGCIGKFVQIFGSTRHPDCAYKDLKRC